MFFRNLYFITITSTSVFATIIDILLIIGTVIIVDAVAITTSSAAISNITLAGATVTS